jgi:hypothetical protein
MLPFGDATLPSATTVPAGTGVSVGGGAGGLVGVGVAVVASTLVPVLAPVGDGVEVAL